MDQTQKQFRDPTESILPCIRAPESNTPIGFFWDIENVPGPSNVNIIQLINSIRKYMVDFKEEIFLTFIRITKETLDTNKSKLLNDLLAAYVLVGFASAGKDGADRMIQTRMDDFWYKNPNGLAVLVTGDAGFAPMINKYVNTRKKKMILIYNDYVKNKPVELDNLQKVSPNLHKMIMGIKFKSIGLSYFAEPLRTKEIKEKQRKG